MCQALSLNKLVSNYVNSGQHSSSYKFLDVCQRPDAPTLPNSELIQQSTAIFPNSNEIHVIQNTRLTKICEYLEEATSCWILEPKHVHYRFVL